MILDWLLPGRLQLLKWPFATVLNNQYRIRLFNVVAPILHCEIHRLIGAFIANKARPTTQDYRGACNLPPAVKAWTIGYYRELSGYKTFIETGTSGGTTIEAVAPIFDECLTIEIDLDRYNDTRRRLRGLRPNVEFLLGDSSFLLSELLRWQTAPAILWLDAHGGASDHYSPSPLSRELNQLERYLQKARHLILIDDASNLDINQDVFKQFLDQARNANYDVFRADDIWRVVPRELFL